MANARKARETNGSAASILGGLDGLDTLDAPERQSSNPDQSHVVRRRMLSSAPAHEVGLDEIELIDETPGEPLSEAPVALDAWPSGAPFDVPTIASVPPARWRRVSARAVGAIGVALALAISVVAIVTRPGPATVAHADAPVIAPAAAAPVVVREAPPVVSAPVVSAPVVSAPVAVAPVPAIAPRATTGTVIGLADHRLWVDGRLAASWQAVIACGPHVVQVGSAGEPRDVDVPCGAEIVVSP